jgi:methionyl-tRNA formyltransferase
MKIILMGTPEFVVPIFDKIADAHDIVGVWTRAPKPTGRKQILTKSPVHIWAENRGIPVYTSIKDFDGPQCPVSNPDYILVAAYGVIIKKDLLEKYKFINIHPSDLPKYRGASPMTTAIYNGDRQSAVCLMQMAESVDSGDILMRREFEINENDTIDTIETRVAEIAADMSLEFFAAPEKFPPVPQIGTPTFTRKWTGADEVIDWTRNPWQIHNQVRSIGGRTKINGIDVKILKSSVVSRQGEEDGLKIITIQPAGKKPMAWKDFVNGLRGAEIKFNGVRKENIIEKETRCPIKK